jgi:hypothetical protein
MTNIASLLDMLFSPEPQNWILIRTMYYRRKLPIELTDLAWKRLVEEHAQYVLSRDFQNFSAGKINKDSVFYDLILDGFNVRVSDFPQKRQNGMKGVVHPKDLIVRSVEWNAPTYRVKGFLPLVGKDGCRIYTIGENKYSIRLCAKNAEELQYFVQHGKERLLAMDSKTSNRLLNYILSVACARVENQSTMTKL